MSIKKVKYKRYIAIIKACNLLKKNDTSVLRFRAIEYENKMIFMKLLKHDKRLRVYDYVCTISRS